jgi:hypothetical protein
MDEARRRFVEIDAAHERDRQDDNLWQAWQAAGADYWVLQHPGLARYRGLDPGRTLDVPEILELAGLINRAINGIPGTWRLSDWNSVRAERSARVAWWHELMGALYAPVDDALERLRQGDRSAMETLLNFLEADPFCHRSGYAKAKIINSLTTRDLDSPARQRLRTVLFAVIEQPTRREFRRYIRLARYLDDRQLRSDLAAVAASGRAPAARHATWIQQELERNA